MSEKSADVLIIGGGVAGLSTALQLARRGKSVIVLERGQLGSGSTGRAAGLLGQLRGTAASTGLLMDGVETVRELEKETGEEIFVQTGSLRVAATEPRVQEIVDLVEMGKAIDFDIRHLSRDEVAEMLALFGNLGVYLERHEICDCIAIDPCRIGNFRWDTTNFSDFICSNRRLAENLDRDITDFLDSLRVGPGR